MGKCLRDVRKLNVRFKEVLVSGDTYHQIFCFKIRDW